MSIFNAYNTTGNDSLQGDQQRTSRDSRTRDIICHGISSEHVFSKSYNKLKNRKFRPFTNINAIKSSLTLSIILNAIMMLGYIYNNKNMEVPIEFRLIYSFITDIVLFYLLYSFNFKIIQVNWNKGLKFWVLITGSVCIAIVLSLVFSEGAIRFLPGSPIPPHFQITANIIKDLIVVLIVLLSTLLYSSIFQRQEALLENEKLIVENIRIRYEVLKNQVDPHFLFNSLNTLDGLIGVDDDKAHDFVENISSVFRYAINNKEIMHLDEELDFTESYANLMKIRYGDNFQIQYHIEDKYRMYYIMPISLQLLVENAIKHNVISNRHSLIITIETTPNDTIRVTNPIQLKNDDEPGTSIGLANLTERYKLLFQKDVLITQTDVFCVEIPLIKQLEPAKTNLLCPL
jgi:hypothetical protein